MATHADLLSAAATAGEMNRRFGRLQASRSRIVGENRRVAGRTTSAAVSRRSGRIGATP
ncbi:hypothetical protein [Haloarcula nitratireducens]|uniref:Uncharacterized protein n=1 Tax=Haloarcula nitratireducens TaxID=2487749 RepID=A0AAW4PD19_9EURY|nr:hypothetical protein [Halomicroarcula nitratireducens]MBX0295729.1 hypothetical protein [Halomicroarcula nitratireducens]